MRRIWSVAAVVFVCAGVAAAASLTATGSAAGAVALPSTLYAGQQLAYAGYADSPGNTLESTDHQYLLSVQPEALDIAQSVPIGPPGSGVSSETETWYMDDEYVLLREHDKSTLRMQTDGNLVLQAESGQVLWATHTTGTGSHNRLTMQSDGNLVMYTSAGKAVWASHTTSMELGQGQVMKSGQIAASHLDDHFIVPPPLSTLTMQWDGNLVYRCGSAVRWQTNTHVPGSYLVMQSDGNLVMYTPAHRAVWASHTSDGGPYSWFEMLGISVYGHNNPFTPRWQANIPYKPGC